MGNPGFQQYTFSSLVNKMKADADKKAEEERRKQEEERRKAEEEARRAAWRRSIPVGPPSVQEDIKIRTGVDTQPPKPSSYQVTREQTQTATPTLSASTNLPNTTTVNNVNTWTPEPEKEKEDKARAWNPPLRTQPSITSVPFLSMPEATNTLNALGAIGQVAKAGYDTLTSGQWQLPDYQTALSSLAQQGQQALQTLIPGLGPQPQQPKSNVQTPAELAMAYGVRNIMERNEATEARRLEYDKKSLVGKALGALTYEGANILDAVMNVGDILQIGADLIGTAQVVPGGGTVGQIWGVGADVNKTIKDEVYNQALTQMRQGVMDPSKQPWPFQGIMEVGTDVLASLVIANPALYSKIANIPAYWEASQKKLFAAMTPTEAQRGSNTAAQLEYAKNLATYASFSGLGTVEALYDDYLNLNGEIARHQTEAARLAALGDAEQDPMKRVAYYAEAGAQGAQAVKLRETTPFDLFDQNYDFVTGGLFRFIFDPTNPLQVGIDLLQLGAAARRASGAAKTAEMASDALAGANKRWIDMIKDNPVVEWMKTNRSKAMTDAYTVFGVLGNLMSGVNTKGDIATVFRHLADGTIANGIALTEFNGAEVAMQAAGDVVDFGRSGILDWRYQNAMKTFDQFVKWLPNLVSLQGEATDVVNKFEVQAEMLGALMRAGAVRHNVSAVGDIPWGATSFNVKAIGNNKAVVEYIGAGKQVLQTSAEMSMMAANKLQANLTKSLQVGSEFQSNWLRTMADFRRNLMSTYTININPSNIIGNMMGGNLTPMMDRGFDLENFRPLDEGMDWITKKTGGGFVDARIAEGAGGIDPVSQVGHYGSQGVVPTGQYNNWFGKILNATTGGLAKKGRELRQGTATLWGGRIKVGEEAMAASIYYAGFKGFFEEEWVRMVEPKMQELLGGVIQDPTVIKYMIDQVVQAGISGSRIDVAKTFQDIANGRVALSIRSISPAVAEVLKGDQVLEVDRLLRNLSTANLGEFNRAIHQVFESQRQALTLDMGKFMSDINNANFVDLDDAKDITDIINQFQNAADMSGLSADEAIARANRVKDLQRQINEQFLTLMQMARSQPQLSDYIITLWHQIQTAKDAVREATGAYRGNLRMNYNNKYGPQLPENLISYAQQGIDTSINYMARNMPIRLQDQMINAFGFDTKELRSAIALTEARAETWAQWTGLPTDLWYTTFLDRIEDQTSLPHHIAAFFTSRTGLPSFIGFNARRYANLPQNEKLVAYSHELAHLFQYDLQITAELGVQQAIDQVDALKKAFPGIEDGWFQTTDALKANNVSYEDDPMEHFANAFNAYLRDGEAPIPELRTVFEQFKDWLTNIVAWIENIMTRQSAQHPDAKPIYDALLGKGVDAREQSGLIDYGAQIKQDWANYTTFAEERWKQFGDEAIAAINRARVEIEDGTAARRVAEKLGADFGLTGAYVDPNDMFTTAQTYMSDLGVDMESVNEVLKQRFGFNDPKFQGALDTMRKGVDYLQRQMFLAVQRYPNNKSFSEFLNAFSDVGDKRKNVLGKVWAIKNKLNDVTSTISPEERNVLFRQLEGVSSKEWNEYWNFAVSRFKVATYRIIEANLDPAILEGLKFVPYADGKEWTLVGPSLRKPNMWQVRSPDGQLTEMPFVKSRLGGVPKAVIDKFTEIRKATELQIADQWGRMGAQAAAEAGIEVADQLLSGMGDAMSQDMLKRVRQRVAEVMANYQQPNFIPENLPRYFMEKLNAGEQALLQIAQEVAVMNSAGFGRLGMDKIAEFNRNILPAFDNTVTGAHQYANEMVGLGMVNFVNEYHPDVWMSVFAPYHYWFTRMGKNALERLLFHPKMSNVISSGFREIERQNRVEDQPNRNMTKFPGGVHVGDATYNTGMNLLFKWIPWFPTMVLNGWANPDRANRAYEYMNEAAKEEGWPATKKSFVGNAVVAYELANQLGLSTYPEYDALFDWLTGKEVTANGKLGEQSQFFRMLGYGAVRFANWAAENGYTGTSNTAQGFADLTVPDYYQHLVGRQAAFDAAQGDITDVQARMVQDVANQRFTGNGPMPEQAFISPEAEAQYRATSDRVAAEYFMRTFLSWLTGAPIAAEYDKELELRAAQEQKRATKYEPSRNTAGSQSAYFGMTDPDSPNYVPGLGPYEDRYAVTAESAPNKPADVDRPGLAAVKSEYFAAWEAIDKKYEDMKQKEYLAHPEWSTREGSKAASDYDKQIKAQRDAEIEALKKKYPSMPDPEAKTPWSLYGARPAETLTEAQKRLVQKAYDNVESLKPADGDPPGYYDRYNEALLAELTRLMGDPQAASDIVFGRALPKVGGSPTGQVGTAMSKTSYTPGATMPATTKDPRATKPVTEQAVQANATVQPDPANQWFDLMREQEELYALPPGLLQAVARHESSFNPKASSGAAHGLMQFTNATWNGLPKSLGVTDIWDPEQSIKAAAFYLDQLRDGLPEDRRNDVAWIVAAYNVGPGAVSGMTKLEDIITYSQEQGYKDAQQRYDYAINIRNEVQNSATSSVATQTPTVATAGGQTFIRPVAGGPELVTQGYGANVEAYAKWNEDYGHEGIDYGVPVGTDVLAAAEGTVVFAGEGNGYDNYGNYVVIEHPNGYKSYYAHLSGFDIRVGDTVTQGQVIAKSGNTGKNTTGPHLHFSLQKEGDPGANNYGMVDPTDFILGKKNLGSTAAATTTKAAQPVGSSDIAWTQTPEQLIANSRNANKPPAEIAADEAVSLEFQKLAETAKSTYPKYANLWDEYRMVRDEDKRAFNEQNPMMRALNLVAYNKKQWDYVEKTFGKGIVEKWALIPRGDDVSEEAGAYYRKYPDVFLAKAWIDGRPEPYRDEGFDPTQPYERDFGKDYETAKEMFGADIWDVVRKYYTIPPWVDGAENLEWKAFKEEYPQFDEWRVWWYALMGDQQTGSRFNQYGGSGGWSGGFGGFDKMGETRNYIKNVDYIDNPPPQWRGGTGNNSDWRKYLALGEVNLRNWRR